ncbi:MAG: tRNA (adenosine(37)-N6)-threonylcarbamoyltransferase complex dimerization subunit type 1 TsaB, partial [Leptothrix sp. (in: b-proteobacteria)]
MPRLITLDTATDTLHLAVVNGDRQWQRALPGGAQASVALLPAMVALLDEAGLALADLDAIAFGRGPGAFTGLRVACAVCQGLALGLNRPLIALDTLAAVAEAAHQRGAGDSVWAMLDARMGEAYAARWQRVGEGHWVASAGGDDRSLDHLAEPALYAPTALRDAIARLPATLAGPGLVAHAAVLDVAAGARHPDALPDGAALAALARAAQARREWIDPALALPLYVRDKVAQTTAERAQVARVAGRGMTVRPSAP